MRRYGQVVKDKENEAAGKAGRAPACAARIPLQHPQRLVSSPGAWFYNPYTLKRDIVVSQTFNAFSNVLRPALRRTLNPNP